MGKYFGLVVAGALLLTGCASGEPEAAAPTVTVTATPEAAPITMEAIAPETIGDPEAEFLGVVKDGWVGEAPSDEDLLAAGNYACAEFPKGFHYTEVTAVSGEGWEAGDNNLRVTASAGRYLCPEYDPAD